MKNNQINTKNQSVFLILLAMGGVFIILFGLFLFWIYYGKTNETPIVVEKGKTSEAKKAEWYGRNGVDLSYAEQEEMYDDTLVPQTDINLPDTAKRKEIKMVFPEKVSITQNNAKDKIKKSNTKQYKPIKKSQASFASEKELADQGLKEIETSFYNISDWEMEGKKGDVLVIKLNRDSIVNYKISSRTENKIIFENNYISYPSKIVVSINNQGDLVYRYLGFEVTQDKKTIDRIKKEMERKRKKIKKDFFLR